MRTTNKIQALIFSTAFAVALFTSCKEKRYKDALSPEASMKTFQLDDAFSVEPFATEPAIKTPVSMVIDEQGVVYVVEMADYPYNAEPGKGKGVIRVLSDSNKDGKIDTSILFADGLPSATSMLPWKGGLIVAAAPDILYLKDTTGDFKADIKEVLFTGFFADNSEAQITSLRFGIDNWIYANNHGQRGEVRFNRNPAAAPLNMSGGDFRFRLDRGLFEKESGSGQFGMAVDDWGHRFYTQNTLHIQQAPIRWRYLHRHDFLPSDNADINVSDHELVMFQKTPPPYWRAERSAARQKDFDERKLDRKEYAEGHFTGASGGTFYGGDAFAGEYYGSVFTGDVAGNLVHRDVIRPKTNSPEYVASRGEKEKDKEFLAATDPWFRPVNFYAGPDGCLYIVDMYRQHIETPVSIPEALKTDMDFANGDQYGRIYRVFPKNAAATNTATPNLSNATTAVLVEQLAHPNQWWRQQAQRVLLERQDSSAIPFLKTMFATHKDARARLHALYALEGLNALNIGLVQQALKDVEPGVREQALILAERYPATLPHVLQMTNDSAIQVAFQATLSLGEFSSPLVVPALGKVIERYAGNRLFQKAVLSSNAGSSSDILLYLVKENNFFNEANKDKSAFIKDLGFVVGARQNNADIAALLDLLSASSAKIGDDYQAELITGLSRGVKSAENKSKADPKVVSSLKKYGAGKNKEIEDAINELRKAIGDSL